MADDDDSGRSLGELVSDTRSETSKGKSDRSKARGSALSSGLSKMGSDERDSADRASSKIGPVQYRKGGKIRKRKRSGKRMKARR